MAQGDNVDLLDSVAALLFGLMTWSIVSSPIVLPWMYIYFYSYNFYGMHLLVTYWAWSHDESEYHDSRRWPTFSRSCFLIVLLRRFFDLQMSVHKELDMERRQKYNGEEGHHRSYIVALHPHGLGAEFRVLLDGMLSEALGEDLSFRSLVANFLFKLPIMRELCLWTGCIDASAKVAERALSFGHSLLIIPGGEHEQIMTEKGKEKLYLRNRKGFIKLALKHGIPIIPTYVFGITDVYQIWKGFLPLRKMIVQRLRVCLLFYWGLWNLPFVPSKVPVRVVFGAPIRFPPLQKEGYVSQEELDAAHSTYITALTELFETNKTSIGYGNRQLQIL
eukprot:207791_1